MYTQLSKYVFSWEFVKNRLNNQRLLHLQSTQRYDILPIIHNNHRFHRHYNVYLRCTHFGCRKVSKKTLIFVFFVGSTKLMNFPSHATIWQGMMMHFFREKKSFFFNFRNVIFLPNRTIFCSIETCFSPCVQENKERSNLCIYSPPKKIDFFVCMRARTLSKIILCI